MDPSQPPINNPPSPTTNNPDTPHPKLLPHRIILSLFQQPYKSIMHAHFRLIGPASKLVGDRSEAMKELEKEVAERVFEMLRSRGGSASSGRRVKFLKLVRFGKGMKEEVKDDWALSKIHKDLIRRMESVNSWRQKGVDENDDEVLAVTPDEYEELKNEVRAKTGCDDVEEKTKKRAIVKTRSAKSRKKKAVSVESEPEDLLEETESKLPARIKGDSKSADESNGSASKNEVRFVLTSDTGELESGRVDSENIVSAQEEPIELAVDSNRQTVVNSKSPLVDSSNVSTIKNVCTPKVKLALDSDDEDSENTSPNAARFAKANNCTPLDKVLSPKTPKKIAFSPHNNASYPLQAKLFDKKLINVTVSYNKKKRNPSSKANHLAPAQDRPSPTAPTKKLSPKTPHRNKKFVTPTASALDKTKYFTSPNVNESRGSREAYVREAKRFEVTYGKSTFPEILHAMVTNASLNLVSVLYWNDAGDGFVVGKVGEMEFVLKHYFRSSQLSSFIRQLNLYGWKKEDGSYHHPFFHRDMIMDESVLRQFVRGGASVTPVCPTPKRSRGSAKKGRQEVYEMYQPTCVSDRSSVKRAAFRNACNEIKSAFEVGEVKAESESDSEEESESEDDVSVSLPANYNKVSRLDPSKSRYGLRDEEKENDEGSSVKVLAVTSGPGVEEKQPADQPQKRKRGRPKKIRPPCSEVRVAEPPSIKKRGPGRPRKYPKSHHQAKTFSPTRHNAIVTHPVPFAHNPYDVIYANADSAYDALWLSKADEIFSAPSQPQAMTHTPVRNHNPIGTRRLSFLPTTNVELQTNHFSPIRPQSFSHPDSASSEELEAMNANEKQAISTTNECNTPSKDQSGDVSLIEFSWKSSASYPFQGGVAADLPSLDVDGFVACASEHC